MAPEVQPERGIGHDESSAHSEASTQEHADPGIQAQVPVKDRGDIGSDSEENGMITLLSYHIIDAKALQNLTNISSIKTLEGSSLAVNAQQNLIGGANVIASMRYDNGIIYVIDQVLVPIRLSI